MTAPDATPESQPHWDGLKEGRYLIQQCGECGTRRHYPRPVCARCFSLEFDWIAASGRGTVHSWTVTHQVFDASVAGQTPYVLATVDLEEGVRMLGRLHDADAGALRIGTPVRMTFDKVSDELTVAGLRLA
ncbi:Zn-ribbon domain-containing OB-fold protein [Ramlibacter sp.]|uniref:Zn-ribbon domain-containing OB-fold protein n=1 Tax=Ramlibacter sp. TaxID=1917967 RepID=UPI003D0A07CC